jgi:hypothetical protein
MKKIKKISFARLVRLFRKQLQLFKDVENLHKIERELYIEKNLFANPKYNQPDKLNMYEYAVFSQNGEDGIIEEIFRRILPQHNTTQHNTTQHNTTQHNTTQHNTTQHNTTQHNTTQHRPFFVEFGVGNGTENNSINLLYKGWNGVWIEGNKKFVKTIQYHFSKAILSDKLKVLHNFINAENIEELFKKANVPSEFDLLSIDIDRNDYYVWDAIKLYHPKVVIVEYNSIFRPNVEFVVPYNPQAIWDKTSNFGASLSALYKLGLEKGYKLVACDFAGVNAFFVREDLIGDKFQGPFTPENHYEPPRYFLYTKNGHPRKVIL